MGINEAMECLVGQVEELKKENVQLKNQLYLDRKALAMQLALMHRCRQCGAVYVSEVIEQKEERRCVRCDAIMMFYPPFVA